MHLMLVHTSAEDGREAEFNDWYDDHVRELLDLPGIVAAQRFRLSPTQFTDGAAANVPGKYLLIVEIEGAPADTFAAMRRRGSRRGIHVQYAENAVYEELRPRVTRDKMEGRSCESA
jgi:hypothetical protein